MLIRNPNQVGLRHDSQGLLFYNADNEVVFEVSFEKASLATDLAVDCLAVAQEMLREYAK